MRRRLLISAAVVSMALGFYATFAWCETGTFLPRYRGILLCLLLAFYLLPLKWLTDVLRRAPRTRPGFCARCGYNLTGNTSGVCPECGMKVD